MTPPHLDKDERVIRAWAAEETRRAQIERDRAENEACIREQVEGAPRRGCQRCGDPYATLDMEGICDLCRHEEKFDKVRDKLGPEELYPEHFPEGNDENEKEVT